MTRTKVPDREAVRAALQTAHGIQAHAARALGVPRSTLQQWLASGPFAELAAYADELRAAYAPHGQGRPWVYDERRSREAVAAAWESSGRKLAVAARALGLPRTSLRHLVHRYGLPDPPAPGRSRRDGDSDGGSNGDSDGGRNGDSDGGRNGDSDGGAS